MPTFEEFKNLSPEERTAVTNQIGKKILTTIVVRVAITVTVSLIAGAILAKVSPEKDIEAL